MLEAWDILIASLVKGDKQAYSSVFREFYAPLVFYSQKYVSNRDAAEDIVQEFFCHLWENRRKMAHITSFKTYFYTSIRNRSLNYLRDNHLVSIDKHDVITDDDFLREMMQEEVYRELYAALQKLPEKCRRIFALKLEGKSNQEIADILGITDDTVRSQLRNGREVLQKELTGLMALVVLFWITSN